MDVQNISPGTDRTNIERESRFYVEVVKLLGSRPQSEQERDKMFPGAVPDNTKKSLAVLGQSGILKDAYLAGGTACAFHLGHRISADLGFFTPAEFVPREFGDALRRTGKFVAVQESRGTVRGSFEDIQFSLFFYKYPMLFPFLRFGDINIAALQDLAAMKLLAISDRGVRRDFVDLYFICQEISLEEVFGLYDRKYGNFENMRFHILKSLVYFADADAETQELVMLKKVKWDEIKGFFEEKVREIARQYEH